MNDTIAALILFGGGILATIIGTYFVIKLAEKEEKEKIKAT